MVNCLQIATRMFFEIAKNKISDSSKIKTRALPREQNATSHLPLRPHMQATLPEWRGQRMPPEVAATSF